VAFAFHLLFNASIAAAIVATYRHVKRHSPALAAVLLAGVLVRIVLSVTLFWLSSQNVAALAHLHSGDGFWQLAPDARSYYRDAAIAAAQGFDTVTDLRGSYGFVLVLAAWLRLAGMHPLAGAWLNVLLYVCIMLLIVRATSWSLEARRLAVPAAIGFSFAPLFVVHSTQPMKEALFAAQVVWMGAALSVWIRQIRHGDPGRWPAAIAALVICTALTLLMGSIRIYYAWLTWAALAAALLVFAPFREPRRLGRYGSHAALGLGLLWVAANTGAGPSYQNPLARWIGDRSRPLATVLDFRIGGHDQVRPVALYASAGAEITDVRERFEEAGGSTTMVFSPRLARLVGDTLAGEAVGVALMLIPVSILRAAEIVTFDGGRGLLFLTDLDTLFCDAVLIVLLLAALRVRRSTAWAPELWLFSIALAVVTALAIAFVITNYGTLVRLRMLVVMPIWAFPAALAAVRAAGRPTSPASIAS